MPFVLEHPDKLTAAHYRVIGEITYKWALIEFLVHDLAGYFLGLDKPRGRIVLYKTGAREKLTVLKTIAGALVKESAIAAELRYIAKTAGDLNDRRNEIAHGVWGHPTASPRTLYLMYVAEGKDRVLPKAKYLSSTDLKPLVSDLDRLLARIRKLYRDAGVRSP